VNITLNLDILLEGLPGVTKVTGAYLREASIVALLKNGHHSGVLMKVEGIFEDTVSLIWDEKDDIEVVDSWKNDRDVANFGAVGIALLLLHHFSEYKNFELSDIGTGIDYWMGTKKTEDKAQRFLQKEARLEISGIFRAIPSNSIEMRIKLKKKQISASDDTGLPGWIAIVEFSLPKSKIVKK
jgi:hypothetical protein